MKIGMVNCIYKILCIFVDICRIYIYEIFRLIEIN